MNDWQKTIETGSEERLNELKVYLLHEMNQLENQRKEIKKLQEKLEQEQKRMDIENRFFDNKMDILQSGFRQLDVDRQKLEKERMRFELEKELFEDDVKFIEDDIVAVLFRGASNPLTLRKRYKDLMKIYHPDNLCGDAQLVQLINKEYEKRKAE